jgi:hypothetical protein
VIVGVARLLGVHPDPFEGRPWFDPDPPKMILEFGQSSFGIGGNDVLRCCFKEKTEKENIKFQNIKFKID